MSDVTQERLKELFYYDPGMGLFIRRISRHKHLKGEVAGSFLKNGRIEIGISGSVYYAHRLAWLYVYGAWPKNLIDHIDGNPANNRISNLRDVTHSENSQNQIKAKANNKTGFLGVYIHGGKYRAVIRVSGKDKYLGCFDTPKEAHEVYKIAKRIHHSTCSI
jgi:hypothetical protein